MLFSVINTIMRGGQISVTSVLMQIFALLLVIFLILPFHEWAHAFVAYILGDKAQKAYGRMTLNPLRHLNPMGMIMFLLFGFGSYAFGILLCDSITVIGFTVIS